MAEVERALGVAVLRLTMIKGRAENVGSVGMFALEGIDVEMAG
jgi:hypothetical protein